MNLHTTLAALLLMLPATFMPAEAFACAGGNNDVKLHLSPSRIQVVPPNRCLYVADENGPVNMTMNIEVKTHQGIEVAANQVVVSTTAVDLGADFPVKQTESVDDACDPGIQFNGTYIGGKYIIVEVTGQKTTTGVGCYDIEIKGLGTLDPRAKIVRQNLSMSPGQTFAQLLDAIEVLENTAYSPLFDIKPIDDFFQAEYGISENEARRLAAQYRNQNAKSAE